MTKISVAILLLFSAKAAFPQSVVVQDWKYDEASNSVILHIVNGSAKEITGYNISVKETYADGHVSTHEILCDYVGRLALLEGVQGTSDEAGIRKQFGDGLFHPGEVRNEKFGVHRGLKNFEAVVDVIAYADKTAEASNNGGLERLLVHRRASVASTRAANEIIKAAMADSKDTNPAATAAAKVQERIAVWKAQRTATDFEPGEAQSIVTELKTMSAHPDSARLKQYVDRRDKQVTTLGPHADLKKIGGPQ